MIILLHQLTEGFQFGANQSPLNKHVSKELRMILPKEWTVYGEISAGKLSTNVESIDKRNRIEQTNSPCSCPHKTKYVDSGVGSFPRLHKSIICDDDNKDHNRNICYSGNCEEVFHDIFVLKIRTSEIQIDNRLPDQIKETFYLDHQVSII